MFVFVSEAAAERVLRGGVEVSWSEPDLLPLLQGVVGILVLKFCPAFTVRNNEISSNIMSLERKDERK